MIYIIFGKQRSGKTTFEAKLVQDNKRKLEFCNKLPSWLQKVYRKFVKVYDHVYCTDPDIQDTTVITYKNFGKWCPHDNSLIILAEAGVGVSNRAWKSLPFEFKRMVALHSHHKCDIWCDSQTVDIDCTIRNRAYKIYVCRRFGPWSLMKYIPYKLGVNKVTEKIDEVYMDESGLAFLFSLLFGMSFFFRRKPYYKYFNSWADDYEYPEKDPC